MKRFLTGLLSATVGATCSSSHPRPSEHSTHHHHHGSFAGAEEWSRLFDDPSRDEWQRPDEVLRALELEPTMTVADVGAGTGYFAVRLARAVPGGAVIATDLEPDMVRFLAERARREKLSNLRAVLASETGPNLSANSVDRVLLVHVWHHLAHRREYARGLVEALRPGGKLFVVDDALDATFGPPPELRIAPEAVVAVLEQLGLVARHLKIPIPGQYVVEGRRP